MGPPSAQEQSDGYPSDYQWIEGVPMRLEVESAVLDTLL